MSQNWRKMAKMLHNAAKKFDWVKPQNSYICTKTPNMGECDCCIKEFFVYVINYNVLLITMFR